MSWSYLEFTMACYGSVWFWCRVTFELPQFDIIVGPKLGTTLRRHPGGIFWWSFFTSADKVCISVLLQKKQSNNNVKNHLSQANITSPKSPNQVFVCFCGPWENHFLQPFWLPSKISSWQRLSSGWRPWPAAQQWWCLLHHGRQWPYQTWKVFRGTQKNDANHSKDCKNVSFEYCRNHCN